ncbi:hypothetical protein JOF41_002120 [Saccharothrix coeruleofusca]|nr:hypothetical protein [Saccharothrix coeruleofusca]MBP2335942.1 hypothetical protein [Saccharothrix coeruleofusca]
MTEPSADVGRSAVGPTGLGDQGLPTATPTTEAASASTTRRARESG